MSTDDWSRSEIEAIVDDYLAMLAAELSGVRYSKAAHRRALMPLLRGRSAQSIEFKHPNISAILLKAGFPYIDGYKPRHNYQSLLAAVVNARLASDRALLAIAAADADRPIALPEVPDILAILARPPRVPAGDAGESTARLSTLGTNYVEREARNASLGAAGELFALSYERTRLIHAGRERLAARIEHTSRERGDHAGFDILSFEPDGAERMIEVKTTTYGSHTPFFASRNEVTTSKRYASHYHVYRLFSFRRSPRLYTLTGAIGDTCRLESSTYLAMPR